MVLQRTLLLLCILSGFSFSALAQTGTISGFIKDNDKVSVPGASVEAKAEGKVAIADNNGFYTIEIPANKEVQLTFSFVGMSPRKLTFTVAPGEKRTENITMKWVTLGTFEVTDKRRTVTMDPLDPATVDFIPLPNDDISALVKSQLGVSSNNELSSSYSVRGGNFDENLIYVNDIEIYRPFLVRSGQQEGLSFPNSDMVESILFSAGGFEAKYGDKLSSVLDIKYRRPTAFAGSARASLLGGALHLEGTSKTRRFRHISGVRYKTNQYILNSLQTQGDYRPNFADFQTYLTYDLTTNWELGFLGHFSQNQYQFIPETRNTEFGTVNEALKLTVFFDGQEIDEFQTFTGAFAGNYKSDDGKLLLKFTTSAFRSIESETFDIRGQYRLDELERDLGSDNFGDVAFNRGVGTFLNHARNNLDANVYNVAHRGFYDHDGQYLQWGIKYQREVINDKLSEWNLIDSAGFSLPQSPANQIVLQDVVKAQINLATNRYSAFVQNTWNWPLTSKADSFGTPEIDFTAGVRAQFWDFNNQFVPSPRINFAYTPNWHKEKFNRKLDSVVHVQRDIVFRLSAGFYNQPPFYRELRDFEGRINQDIRAQRSMHFVLGSDYQFQMWNRTFKLVTELYYKHMWDLIPYELDNVRIRYFAENISRGYAAGIDMKLNGEFIKGIESWATLSVMKTEEDIANDFFFDYFNQAGEEIIFGFTADDTPTDSILRTPGAIPRNLDQRVNFGLFFQDEMPRLEKLKVHLSLLFGTGLPFGPPERERYKDVLRAPAYRRVDIGTSYQLIGPDTKFKNPDSKLTHIKSAFLSLEVFNLLGISNTISYLWIRDVTNRQYAIPNFLTSRRINLKLAVKF